MYTNLRIQFRKIFLGFFIHVYTLAKYMNLMWILQVLEYLAPKVGLLKVLDGWKKLASDDKYRAEYSNLYAGTANNGNMPLDDLALGTWSDGLNTYKKIQR